MDSIIKIDTEFIKLDGFLKHANLVMSGGEAKLLIQEGLIKVNGQPENRRGKKLYPGDLIQMPDRSAYRIESSQHHI